MKWFQKTLRVLHVCYSLVNISILQSMLIPMSDTGRKWTHDKQNFQMNYFFKFPSSTTKHSPLITLKSTSSESKLLSAVTLFALYQWVSATALAFKQTDPFIRVSEADAPTNRCVWCVPDGARSAPYCAFCTIIAQLCAACVSLN